MHALSHCRCVVYVRPPYPLLKLDGLCAIQPSACLAYCIAAIALRMCSVPSESLHILLLLGAAALYYAYIRKLGFLCAMAYGNLIYIIYIFVLRLPVVTR